MGADGLHRASAPNWSEPVHPSIRDIRAGAGSRRATASRSPLERARAGDEASDSESYRSVSGRSTGSPWRMRRPVDKIVMCAANCWRASIVARAGGRHHRSDTARSHPAHRYLRSRSDRALARGRVALLGDAAHDDAQPRTGRRPGHRGCSRSRRMPRRIVFDRRGAHRYEQRRVARANGIVFLAASAAIAQWSNPMAAWVRDWAMSWPPASVAINQAKRLMTAHRGRSGDRPGCRGRPSGPPALAANLQRLLQAPRTHTRRTCMKVHGSHIYESCSTGTR